MKHILLFSTILMFDSCGKTLLENDIEEYCKCSDEILQMDLYDYERKGKHVEDRLYVLSNRIDSLIDSQETDHNLSDLKRRAECSTKLVDAAYKRMKELELKHGR